MSYAVFILPRAQRHYAAALIWWRANRPRAPHLLEIEFERVVALLADVPRAGVRVSGQPGVRRIPLRRTRYAVFYRLLPRAERIELLDVWHASRRRPVGRR